MKIMICDHKGVVTGYYFDYTIPTTIYGFVALKAKTKMRVSGRVVWNSYKMFNLKFIDVNGIGVPAIQLQDKISHSVIPEYFEKYYGVKVKVWSSQ